MKKKIQVDLSFFPEKNIQDRLNAIVRFVLSWSNMSKVLYGNKKTGLCREKNRLGKVNITALYHNLLVKLA